MPPLALPAKRSVINTMYGVRFDTTNASPADLARLQTCLQQFKSVQGIDPQSAGDEGSLTPCALVACLGAEAVLTSSRPQTTPVHD